jgi:hypothetical protein
MRQSRAAGAVAGHFGDYHIDRVSIVDGEFCCLRAGTLLARARQAKGRAQNGALAEWRAGVPPCGGGALSGPEGARLEDVEKVVRLRAGEWLFVSGSA